MRNKEVNYDRRKDGNSRKPTYLRRERIGIRLPAWMVEKVRGIDNYSRFIENLIIQAMGWKEPTKPPKD